MSGSGEGAGWGRDRLRKLIYGAGVWGKDQGAWVRCLHPILEVLGSVAGSCQWWFILLFFCLSCVKPGLSPLPWFLPSLEYCGCLEGEPKNGTFFSASKMQFLLICLFASQSDRKMGWGERERQRMNFTSSGSLPKYSQQLRLVQAEAVNQNSLGVFHVVGRGPTTLPPSAAFLGTLAGNWVRRAAGAWASKCDRW